MSRKSKRLLLKLVNDQKAYLEMVGFIALLSSMLEDLDATISELILGDLFLVKMKSSNIRCHSHDMKKARKLAFEHLASLDSGMGFVSFDDYSNFVDMVESLYEKRNKLVHSFPSLTIVEGSPIFMARHHRTEDLPVSFEERILEANLVAKDFLAVLDIGADIHVSYANRLLVDHSEEYGS